VNNQSKQRYISLQATITIGMAVLGFVVSAIVTGIFYFNFSNQVREDIKLRLRNIADIAAIQLDPQELATITDRIDVTNTSYIKYQKELSDIINTNVDVINIYSMRQDEQGTIYFYLDAGDPTYVPDAPGAIPYEQPTELLVEIFASPQKTVVENHIYTDEFGSVISAYVPIYKQNGTLESVLGVDMKADTVLNAERNALQKILIYFGISIPLIILLAWFMGYRFSRQSVALTTVAARIAHLSESNIEMIPVSIAGNNKEAFDLIQVFNKMYGDTQVLIQTLEQRVAERTTDLKIASQNSDRRARQFEVIAQVVRAISSIQDLDTLLLRITQVISEQFNIYHTGIFLLDNEREFAVLRASNSEGGRIMLERGHKLRVGQTGIVGLVTATGRARIALDVGADAAYFDNPNLPNTRSEIALPLRYSGQVIGALDVQSIQANAFGLDDVEALNTLADQVAITINNTLILEDARRSLIESQSTFSDFTRDSWKIMQSKSLGLGFQLKESMVTPLEQPLTGNDIQEAVKLGLPVISNQENGGSALVIPIRLRGRIIGIMNLRTRNDRKLTSDDADIAESVGERLSLAIETALLIQSAQHRADIERITTDISSKINASTRFETILQTAAKELSRALGGSDVLVQIEPAAIELGMAG
jgi:GAF domain-containing protein